MPGRAGTRRPKMDAELGGGNFMGQGCYTVSVARLLLGEPTEVQSARAVEDTPGSRADLSLTATLSFGKDGAHGRGHLPVTARTSAYTSVVGRASRRRSDRALTRASAPQCVQF